MARHARHHPRRLDGPPGVVYLYDEHLRVLGRDRESACLTGYADEEMAQRSPRDSFAGSGNGKRCEPLRLEANGAGGDGFRPPWRAGTR